MAIEECLGRETETIDERETEAIDVGRRWPLKTMAMEDNGD